MATAPFPATIQVVINAELIAEAIRDAVEAGMRSVRPTPRFYSPQEFADLLGISQSLVCNSLRSHEIHGIKVGTRWCIPDTEIERMLKEQTE